MPQSLDPGASYPIALDADKEIAAEKRPTFFVRGLTMRDQQILGDALNASLELTTTEEIFSATCELLTKYLTGWKHMGQFEFPSELRDVLSHQEARELLRKILHGSYVTPDEKKSLESPR